MGTSHTRNGSASLLWLLGFVFFAIGTVVVLLLLDVLEGVGLLRPDGGVAAEGAPWADDDAERGVRCGDDPAWDGASSAPRGAA